MGLHLISLDRLLCPKDSDAKDIGDLIDRNNNEYPLENNHKKKQEDT